MYDFERSYGTVPTEILLRDRIFKHLDYQLDEFNMSATVDKLLLMFQVRKECAESWQMRCRRRFASDKVNFYVAIFAGTSRLRDLLDGMISSLSDCYFGCFVTRASISIASNIVLLKSFARRLISIMGLWTFCPSDQCRSELKQVYINITNDFEVSWLFDMCFFLNEQIRPRRELYPIPLEPRLTEGFRLLV